MKFESAVFAGKCERYFVEIRKRSWTAVLHFTDGLKFYRF